MVAALPKRLHAFGEGPPGLAVCVALPSPALCRVWGFFYCFRFSFLQGGFSGRKGSGTWTLNGREPEMSPTLNGWEPVAFCFAWHQGQG